MCFQPPPPPHSCPLGGVWFYLDTWTVKGLLTMKTTHFTVFIFWYAKNDWNLNNHGRVVRKWLTLTLD